MGCTVYEPATIPNWQASMATKCLCSSSHLIQTYNPHNPCTEVSSLAPHQRTHRLQGSPCCFSFTSWHFTWLYSWHHHQVPTSKTSSVCTFTTTDCHRSFSTAAPDFGTIFLFNFAVVVSLFNLMCHERHAWRIPAVFIIINNKLKSEYN